MRCTKTRQELPPGDILRQAAPDAQAVTRLLRPLIRRAAPRLAETGYGGWRCIAYRHPKAGYVCRIFPLEPVVKLYFEQGVRLADPIGILEGNGRQTRYMSFPSPAAVKEKAAMVAMLVREAVAIKALRSGGLRSAAALPSPPRPRSAASR
jgi:hypothetical protein